MKKTVLTLVLTATALTSVPAFGDPPPWAHAYGRRQHEQQRYDNYERNYDRDDSYEYERDGRYDNNYQRDYRRTSNGIAYWQGGDGRYYCRRGNGTTGLLVGAALGALLGRSIDLYGDRSTGTVLGAAAGALLGREVARGRTRCN
jgi:hypothetical protein